MDLSKELTFVGKQSSGESRLAQVIIFLKCCSCIWLCRVGWEHSWCICPDPQNPVQTLSFLHRLDTGTCLPSLSCLRPSSITYSLAGGVLPCSSTWSRLSWFWLLSNSILLLFERRSSSDLYNSLAACSLLLEWKSHQPRECDRTLGNDSQRATF